MKPVWPLAIITLRCRTCERHVTWRGPQTAGHLVGGRYQCPACSKRAADAAPAP